jgi:hypothetical protein
LLVNTEYKFLVLYITGKPSKLFEKSRPDWIPCPIDFTDTISHSRLHDIDFELVSEVCENYLKDSSCQTEITNKHIVSMDKEITNKHIVSMDKEITSL